LEESARFLVCQYYLRQRCAPFYSLPKRELIAHLNPRKADQGEPSNLSLFWKTAIGTLKNDLTLDPILKSTTRQGVEGFSVWHNPFFNLPHELAQYKAPWEHLQTNFIDNLSDAPGTIFSASTLENYLTEETGVKWHRDQVYITIHYKDKKKTRESSKPMSYLAHSYSKGGRTARTAACVV
jgi:hypothetical protein